MTKRVSALILSAAAIAAPVLAQPAAHPIAFAHDGIHFVGTVIDRDDGTRLIAGREVESGRPFALTVANGTVDGTYDNQPVSYPVPRLRAVKPGTAASVAVASSTGM